MSPQLDENSVSICACGGRNSQRNESNARICRTSKTWMEKLVQVFRGNRTLFRVIMVNGEKTKRYWFHHDVID